MRAAAEGAKGATMVAGEYVEGVIAGKAFALREWQIKREKREFAQLVELLRVAKWRKAHPTLVAEYNRRWAAAPEVRDRTKRLQRAWRAAQYCAKPLMFACKQCGATWCKAPWIRGEHPEFCADRCRQRWRYSNDESFRARQLANARKQHARKT